MQAVWHRYLSLRTGTARPVRSRTDAIRGNLFRLGTLALTTGAALGMLLPASGQEAASAKVSCPATAVLGKLTRVSVSFTLPDKHRLTRNPRVTVTSDAGRQVELLPIFVTQAPPKGAGYRELHSTGYPAGTYQVRAEVAYVDGQGTVRTALSPAVTLRVP